MGGGTISTKETRIEALKLQSSAQGATLPVVFGVTRVPGNLLWQGGFKATKHVKEQRAGKGGGTKIKSTTYTYSVSVAMALCEGKIIGVPRIWRGKKVYSVGISPTQVLEATHVATLTGSGGSTSQVTSGTPVYHSFDGVEANASLAYGGASDQNVLILVHVLMENPTAVDDTFTITYDGVAGTKIGATMGEGGASGRGIVTYAWNEAALSGRSKGTSYTIATSGAGNATQRLYGRYLVNAHQTLANIVQEDTTYSTNVPYTDSISAPETNCLALGTSYYNANSSVTNWTNLTEEATNAATGISTTVASTQLGATTGAVSVTLAGSSGSVAPGSVTEGALRLNLVRPAAGAGSGNPVVTVTNAATWLGTIAAYYIGTIDVGDGTTSGPIYLGEGVDYTVAAGVYTFDSAFLGKEVSIEYQYLTGSSTQQGLADLGMTMFSGAVGQSTWSLLTGSFSSEAIPYSGIAYVAAQDYELGGDATIENHNFEVQGRLAYHLPTADANPAMITLAMLTDGRYGALFPAGQLNFKLWSNYCGSAQILMSPAFTEQMTAAELVRTMAQLTNTEPVWSAGQLKMMPRGDKAITASSGYGDSYSPNVTPVYDLDDSVFLPRANGGEPVAITPRPSRDAKNHIRLEFRDRFQDYALSIAEAKDQADIDTTGLRSADVIRAHWICDLTVATRVAQLLLQRSLHVRNEYEFKLPWTFALLEPMDLVTLTDSYLGLSLTAVRILEIAEGENGELDVRAEEFPAGVATASTYGSQAGAGFTADYNADPGSVVAPFIFEAPADRTVTGLEVYAAVIGSDADWGGCNVWVSLDGTSYRNVGTVWGGARYGTLTGAISGGNLPVQLNASETITAASASDAAALNSLCYIGGSSKEYLAHQGATLTGVGAYTLSGLVRGAYGTNGSAAHANADPFAMVDESIAKSGPLELAMIGQTIYFKFTSFNVFGGAEQDLSEATQYSYTITGEHSEFTIISGDTALVPDPEFKHGVIGGGFDFWVESSNVTMQAPHVARMVLNGTTTARLRSFYVQDSPVKQQLAGAWGIQVNLYYRVTAALTGSNHRMTVRSLAAAKSDTTNTNANVIGTFDIDLSSAVLNTWYETTIVLPWAPVTSGSTGRVNPTWDWAFVELYCAASDLSAGTVEIDKMDVRRVLPPSSISGNRAGSVPMKASPSGQFLKDSGDWATLAPTDLSTSVATSSSTAFSVSSADIEKPVRLTGASAVTVTVGNSHGFAAGQSAAYMRDTAQTVTFAVSGSQVIRSPGSRLAIPEQYAIAVLTYLGSNVWQLSGV